VGTCTVTYRQIAGWTTAIRRGIVAAMPAPITKLSDSFADYTFESAVNTVAMSGSQSRVSWPSSWAGKRP
jgi:hypothetical protein